MQILGDVLKKAIQFLKDKNVSEARLSAEWLLASIVKMKRLDLYMNFDRPLSEHELKTYRESISRRLKHEPISYILKSQPFYNLDLIVSPDVLIPRKETEELVSLVLEYANQQEKSLKVVDICTGSGAIACALKKSKSEFEIHASDISKDALEIAKENARANELQITFHHSDLLANISEKFDVIVCNPPYITSEAMKSLEPQVKNFEPHLALCGGLDGLDFYRRLKQEMPKVLNQNARIFFEIGFDQKDAMLALFKEAPYYNVCCLKDSNLNNRFVVIDYIAS